MIIEYRIQEVDGRFYPELKKLWWLPLLNLHGEIRSYLRERDAKIVLNMYRNFGNHGSLGKKGRMI